MKKENLFMDANSSYCHEGDLVYYVVLSAAGRYKVGWQFAEVIKQNMAIWDTLISLSLVKGIYKNKDKAEETCEDENFGSDKKISNSVFGDILKPK